MALDNFRKVNITLNKANQRVLETQIAKVGDANGRELVVQITNNGVIEDQTGTALKLNWKHENGKQGSTNFKILDIKTGKFSVYYPTEMLYKGKVNASIEISSSGQITNSMNFKIIVQADVFDGDGGIVDGVFISLEEVNKKLDDREAEYVELKERQNLIETRYDVAVGAMTIDNEVKDSRVSSEGTTFDNLRERLITIERKLSVLNLKDYPKFYQNKTSVDITGFFENDEFDIPIRYEVTQLSGTETWTTINQVKIDNDLYIKINDVKIKPIGRTIIGEAYGLASDSGNRQDELMLQKIFDGAIKNNSPINFNNCVMKVNSTIFLDKPQHPRNRIVTYGGEFVNIVGGLMFSSHTTNSTGGGYLFNNPVFRSVEGNGAIVFDSRNVRMEFSNPEFYNCDDIWKSESKERYLQSIYVSGAYIVGGKGHVFNSHNAYDVQFEGLVEHRNHYMNIQTPHSVRTSGVIEGMDGYVYRGQYGRGLSFKGVYMEANCLAIPNEPYLKFTVQPSTLLPFNVTLSDLLIQGTPEQIANSAFYMIEFESLPNSFEFSGIWSDTNLIKVNNKLTLKIKQIRAILSQNHVSLSKFVLNDWPVIDIEEGSGEVWGLHANLPLSTVSAIGNGAGATNANGYIISKPEGGIYGGIKSINGFAITPYSNYVLGLAFIITTQFTNATLDIYIDETDGTNIKKFTMPISGLVVGTQSYYLITPPFKFNKAGYGGIRIALTTAEGGSILIKGLSVQRGTIGNPYENYNYK